MYINFNTLPMIIPSFAYGRSFRIGSFLNLRTSIHRSTKLRKFHIHRPFIRPRGRPISTSLNVIDHGTIRYRSSKVLTTEPTHRGVFRPTTNRYALKSSPTLLYQAPSPFWYRTGCLLISVFCFTWASVGTALLSSDYVDQFLLTAVSISGMLCYILSRPIALSSIMLLVVYAYSWLRLDHYSCTRYLLFILQL